MPIDVMYEGVVLARGTKMMSTPAGTFVEMEAPMPVGTRLVLEENGVACPVRVERVAEGGGAGVYVTAEPTATAGMDHEAEAAAPTGEVHAEESAPVATSAADSGAADSGAVESEMPPADTEPLPLAVRAVAAAGGDGASVGGEAVPGALGKDESRPVDANGGKRRGKRRR